MSRSTPTKFFSLYSTLITPLLFRTDGKILRDYLCVVAEKIEDTETFKIVVNVCDEKSNWTYTEVSLSSILNYPQKMFADSSPALV